MFLKTLKLFTLNILLIVPFVLFLFLRLDSIQNDMSNSDAPRWHRRSEEFATALGTKNFSETYQSYHPGVTLMWLTTAVESVIKINAQLTGTEFKTIGNTDGYLLIDTASKIALTFVLFVLLLVHYKFIDILFNRITALAYVFFTAIEPYFIGINRWYHLTSLEVFLGFAAFLAFLIWAELKIKKYLYLGAFFLGLALLTKFSSVIVIPVFLFVFLMTFIADKNRQLGRYVTQGLLFGSIIIGTFVILFPAVWVTPLTVFQKLYLAGVNAKSGDYLSVVFAETNPNIYYLLVLVYKLSPITLLLTVLALFKTLIWKERLVSYFVVYFISTLLLLILSEQKIERYILVFMPAIFVLCAVLLSRVGVAFRNLAIISGLVYTLFVFLNFRPLYSAYYAPFLGGPAQAYSLGIYDDNGEYFAQAAQYLNTFGRDIHVYVPYNREPFLYYFKGKLDEQLELTTDYFVISNDSRRPGILMGANCPDVEKVFKNYNFNATTIYKCRNIQVDF